MKNGESDGDTMLVFDDAPQKPNKPKDMQRDTATYFEPEYLAQKPKKQKGNHREIVPVVDPCTDLANANRFVATHGRNLRYVATWSKWVAWSGERWTVDSAGAHIQAAKATTSEIFDEASALYKTGDNDNAKARFKWAVKSQNAKQIGAMIQLARTDPRVVTDHTQFDADQWLLNVRNGTVDLRTGKLQQHRREDLIAKLCPVVYDPGEACPVWNGFISDIMGGNAELIAYLQRLIGYALTGSIREHVLGFFFGGGSNGKTTFLGAIRHVLGSYAGHATRGILFPHKNEHPTELTDLCGRRFVTCAEVEEHDAFDEARLKDLTGGEPIKGHRMREDFWEFRPTHKLFLAGNHKPNVRGTDDGIWRRIRLIPFMVTIADGKKDKDLPAKLEAEAAGILAWAVRGCVEWQRIGLGDPMAVREATAEYRKDSDLLGDFCSSRLTFDPSGRLEKSTLTGLLKAWAEDLGIKVPGSKIVAARMRVLGAKESTARNALGKVKDCWQGVREAAGVASEAA